MWHFKDKTMYMDMPLLEPPKVGVAQNSLPNHTRHHRCQVKATATSTAPLASQSPTHPSQPAPTPSPATALPHLPWARRQRRAQAHVASRSSISQPISPLSRKQPKK
uniref:Uncharacterized protein n=1 Tax=Hordeum vulgare subsp. vulgare TaxID=112509 RepID=A0A8I7BHU2_HORVV